MVNDRIMIGKFRTPEPPDGKYVGPDGVFKHAGVVCPCGRFLLDSGTVREHWSSGHFDELVYATREEVLVAVGKAMAEKLGTDEDVSYS